jgi:hypothetical protein
MLWETKIENPLEGGLIIQGNAGERRTKELLFFRKGILLPERGSFLYP